MSKLTEILSNLFQNDEKVMVAPDGQRTVAMDTVLQEVDGLVLFDETVPNTATEVTEGTNPVENFLNYASAEELAQIVERINNIEKLVQAVDTVGSAKVEPETEVW